MWRREQRSQYNRNELAFSVLANGIHHIARMAAYRWRKTDDWTDVDGIPRQLTKLDGNLGVINKHCRWALSRIVGDIAKNQIWKTDPIAALKSAELDRRLTKMLHPKPSRTL